MSEIETYTEERECTYCASRHAAEEMHEHVLLTGDTIHGARGTLPDDYALMDCPQTGTTLIPHSRIKDHERVHDRYICTYCNQIYRGKYGLNTHLTRSAGKGPHPVTRTPHEDNYHPHIRLPATTANNIIVPTSILKDAITLTEEEQARDFSIIVRGPELTRTTTSPADFELDTETIAEDICDEFRRFLYRGESLSVPHACQIVEDALAAPYQIKPHTPNPAPWE